MLRHPSRPTCAAILAAAVLSVLPPSAEGYWSAPARVQGRLRPPRPPAASLFSAPAGEGAAPAPREVLIIGSGWGGLSCAHALSSAGARESVRVTVVDALPRPGGLVSDSAKTRGGRPAEAGQHGFWAEYRNIFRLLDALELDEDPLTGYAEQGQWSPRGLEGTWPVYCEAGPQLPTGIGQALFTRFEKLGPLDLATALPLVLAFSEFDDSEEAWRRYDGVSFRDLCVRLGVSKRTYEEIFEPMILTGLFAPGAQCSAAAALGMAYFFVLRHQDSFDVRWCRGNVGEKIFAPWLERMEGRGVTFAPSTRAEDFVLDDAGKRIVGVRCKDAASGETTTRSVDEVVFAVGGAALAGMVRSNPSSLGRHAEFRKFSNLRGTSVLATRIYLDKKIDTPYSANACWGFDEDVGMTWFDITKLHDDPHSADDAGTGSVIEVDFYHANSLLAMDDDSVIAKVKADLDVILGAACQAAQVEDAAVVRLPGAVNWYYPGSHTDMPEVRSEALENAYFAGDIVNTRHGSWSQEKAFVTGVEAANMILGRDPEEGIVSLGEDEAHVAFGRNVVAGLKNVFGGGRPERAPSLFDFLP